MSDNMTLYNAVRTPPPEALKAITGGRLKGMTDINPMWRIKTMTEQFGPCGDGWWYTIDNLWTEAGAGGEIAAADMLGYHLRETYWDGNAYQEVGEWIAYEEKEVD